MNEAAVKAIPMKPSCEPFDPLIDLDAAGWLSAGERASLRAHLDTCAACRARRERSVAIAAALRDIPAPPPPAAWRPPRHRRAIVISLVTAGLAAAAALLLFLPRPQPAPEPPPPRLARMMGQPPTLAAYRDASSLTEGELDQLLAAHDRQINLHEPPQPRFAHLNP